VQVDSELRRIDAVTQMFAKLCVADVDEVLKFSVAANISPNFFELLMSSSRKLTA